MATRKTPERLVTERALGNASTACSNIIRMRVFRGVKWPTITIAVLYWKRCNSATEHFQRKPHKISDLHRPLSKSYRLWDE